MADNDKRIKASVKAAIRETRKAAKLALQTADTAEEALKALENGNG